MARLHGVVKAFHAGVAGGVRRAGGIESSLGMLGQKVTALAEVKESKQGRTAVGVSGLGGE